MFLALIVFSPLVYALAYPGPKATPIKNAIHIDIQGRNPLPTEAPEFLDLRKRANSDYTYFQAPDSVCGYSYGLSDGGFGLCGTSTCGFATGYGLTPEIYCTDSVTANLRQTWSSCVRGASATSCLADSACSDNPGILICTEATANWCNVGTFIGMGVEALWCDSSDTPGTIPISTTYAGQKGRVFQTFEASTTTGSSSSSIRSTTSPTSSSSSSSTTSTSSSSSSTTTSPGPTSTSPTSTPKPTSIGPIVGGVIGGLALLAAVVAGVLIFLRRNRQGGQGSGHEPAKEIPESPNHPQNPPMPNTNGQSDKYPAPAGYMSPATPPTTQNFNQQMQYQQPTPQSQYQQPSPQSQYPAEKYPTNTGVAFSPSDYATTSSNPEQRYSSPPPQNQAIPMQPSYAAYLPPQQQIPVQRSASVEQHQSPPLLQQQQTYYSSPAGAPNFQIKAQPQTSSEIRPESTFSSISAPGSPAPPYVKTTTNMNTVPSVQEMPVGEDIGRLRGEMEGVGSATVGRGEMEGESAPYPLTY